MDDTSTTELTAEAAAHHDHAVETTRRAIGLAHTGVGRSMVRVRSAFGTLGAFGVVLLALYPVGLVLAMALLGFAASGNATPN